MSNTDRETQYEPTARDRTYQERIDELADFLIGQQSSAEIIETETSTATPIAE